MPRTRRLPPTQRFISRMNPRPSQMRSPPIEVNDDEEDDLVLVSHGTAATKAPQTPSKRRKRDHQPSMASSSSLANIIDLDMEEHDIGPLLGDADCELLNIPSSTSIGDRSSASISDSEGEPVTRLTSWLIDDNECKGTISQGACVELMNGEFILVEEIQQLYTMEIRIVGTRLVRTKKLDSFFSMKINEVVILRNFMRHLDGTLVPRKRAMADLNMVSHVRKLVRTNAAFPSHTYREAYTVSELRTHSDEIHAKFSHLTCRWELRYVWLPNKKQPSEFSIRSLTREDCDPEVYHDPQTLRFNWRGDTIKGGSSLLIVDRPHQAATLHMPKGKRPSIQSEETARQASRLMALAHSNSPGSSAVVLDDDGSHSPTSNSTITFDTSPETPSRRLSRALQRTHLTAPQFRDPFSTTPTRLPQFSSSPLHSNPPNPPRRRSTATTSPNAQPHPIQKYTFGDGFCGAGGVSRGARDAGVRLDWSFDKDQRAARAYALNFPEARTYHEAVHDFLAIRDSKKVDIMHLSPPCQTFSPAHTVQGKDDEANSAAIFSVGECIRAARPRVFMLEQTFGLVWETNRMFFNNLVRQMTDTGYSARWGILQCLDYGGPKRSRLIIYGSCPGEALPEFPKPTHSLDGLLPNTTPFTTIAASLAPIRHNTPNHKPLYPYATPRPSISPHQPLNITITCNGGIGNHHYSGLRPYTNREFACLSGFPVEHYFGDVGEIKLIGNAVPPPVARALVGGLVESLDREDGLRGREGERGERAASGAGEGISVTPRRSRATIVDLGESLDTSGDDEMEISASPSRRRRNSVISLE